MCRLWVGMEIPTGKIHILGMANSSCEHSAPCLAWVMLKNEDRAIPREGTR